MGGVGGAVAWAWWDRGGGTCDGDQQEHVFGDRSVSVNQRRNASTGATGRRSEPITVQESEPLSTTRWTRQPPDDTLDIDDAP